METWGKVKRRGKKIKKRRKRKIKKRKSKQIKIQIKLNRKQQN